MTKALAVQQDPLKAAIDSAINTAKQVNEFMYGTEKRAHITTIFAMALVGLAMYMQSIQPALSNYCS